MISNIELRRDSLRTIAKKLELTEQIEAATDRVLWKQSVKRFETAMKRTQLDRLRAEAAREDGWTLR